MSESGGVAGFDDSRVVRTRVGLDGGRTRFRFGSGYLIRRHTVLTAAHVLTLLDDDPPFVGQTCEVLGEGGGWLPGSVIWTDHATTDVAFVEVGGLGDDLAPTPWGRLAGSTPLNWLACGFPEASLDDSGRAMEQLWGRVSGATARERNSLGLTVESRQPRSISGRSGWAGMSGAAVFVDDHVVGVVTSNPSAYPRSLDGVRLDVLCDVASLVEALGEQPVVAQVGDGSQPVGLRQLYLPPRNPTFVGRDSELIAISEERGRVPVVVTHSLVGLGGVGKTSLAVEFAHRCLEEGRVDLVWWFAATDRTALTTSMALVQALLPGDRASGADAEHDALRLRNWLSNTPLRWLVVFDNADAEGVLDGLLPNSRCGQVLITSRRTDWPAYVSVQQLERLPLADGVVLLYALSGRVDEEADARHLVDELDGLALAIEQAGAMIRKTGWPFGRYRTLLHSRGLELHDEDLAGVGKTVAAVWNTSLDQVASTARYGSLVSNVLGVLAYLAADDVPRVLFDRPAIDNVGLLGRGDAIAVALATAGLADFSLISVRDDHMSVHRLVQHLTRLDLERRGKAQEHAFAAHRLVRAALANPKTSIEDVLRLLPHLAENAGHLHRLDLARGGSARALIDRPVAGLFRGQTAFAERLRDDGHHREAMTAFAALLADQSRALGSDHPNSLATRQELLSCLGLPAIQEYSRLVADQARVLGASDRTTLRAQRDLAEALRRVGRFDEAIARLEALCVAQEQILGRRDRDVFATRNDLVRALCETGRFAEALEVGAELVVEVQHAFGQADLEALRAHQQLAIALAKSGRMDDALQRLKVLLAFEEATVGPDHELAMSTRNTIAELTPSSGPRLHVHPHVLDFGDVIPEQSRRRQVTIDNLGGGKLSWVHTQTGDFFRAARSDDRKLHVSIIGPPGTHKGSITIESLGGTLTIDVAAFVRRSSVWDWKRSAVGLAVVACVVAAALVIVASRSNRIEDAGSAAQWTRLQGQLDQIVAPLENDGWRLSPPTQLAWGEGLSQREIVALSVEMCGNDWMVYLPPDRPYPADRAGYTMTNGRASAELWMETYERESDARLVEVTPDAVVNPGCSRLLSSDGGRYLATFDGNILRPGRFAVTVRALVKTIDNRAPQDQNAEAVSRGFQRIVRERSQILDVTCWGASSDCRNLEEVATTQFGLSTLPDG